MRQKMGYGMDLNITNDGMVVSPFGTRLLSQVREMPQSDPKSPKGKAPAQAVSGHSNIKTCGTSAGMSGFQKVTSCDFDLYPLGMTNITMEHHHV